MSPELDITSRFIVVVFSYSATKFTVRQYRDDCEKVSIKSRQGHDRITIVTIVSRLDHDNPEHVMTSRRHDGRPNTDP